MEKFKARELIKARLKAFESEDLEQKSLRVSNILFEFISKLKIPNNLIGCFAPFGDEVLWQVNALERFEYALPSLDGNDLSFFKVPLSEIKSQKHGLILEDNYEICNPKLLIVPGLAFTESGKRLGRGKGFYDRYLSDRDLIKIGVCFNEQVLDDIETHDHDVSMDYVINENTVFKGNK